MSSESLFNAQLNQNGFNDNSILLNNNRRMQQQAQNLFRQRQMISQHQQLQQQQRPVNNVMTMNGLPPTPTLSSQGSPAFSQGIQAIPPAIKSTITPSTNKNLLTPQPMNNQPKAPTMGQAVLRLLQFRDQLSPGDQAQDISFWDSFVDDFFSPNATIKMGLWDNVQKKHAEFDIVQSLIARFFHTHYQCELESIQLTTDQTMEYFLPTGMMLECPRSSLIHRYKNGTLVILSGELSVLFTLDQADGNLKIQQWKFKCNSHDEYISRSKLIPANDTTSTKKKAKLATAKPSFYTPDMLVNSWGLPDRLYEILNVSDNSAQVGEVVFYSQVTGLSPQDALAAISFSLDQPLPFSYPPHTKEELEDIINSPLLTNDFLSMSNIPDTTTTTTNFNNNNSPFINQQNINTAASSAAPTPTPVHTNVIPNQQDIINYTQMNSNAALNNSPHFQNNISVNNVNFNMMNKPMQQQMGNDMNSFQQPNHTMMGAPQQNNGMSNIPQQQQQQQSNNGMVNIPYQQQQQMMQSVNNNPMNNNPMNGSPSQNNNNMAAPPPHMQMQQQAALQRYYQQQRMQQQQQALQMQQRQAMQRLQTPYTESPMSSDSTPSTATPLTIENITPDPSKGSTPRKRKMSLQKDGPKKATKKGKKHQQQQQQQQQQQ